MLPVLTRADPKRARCARAAGRALPSSAVVEQVKRPAGETRRARASQTLPRDNGKAPSAAVLQLRLYNINKDVSVFV